MQPKYKTIWWSWRPRDKKGFSPTIARCVSYTGSVCIQPRLRSTEEGLLLQFLPLLLPLISDVVILRAAGGSMFFCYLINSLVKDVGRS